MKCMDFIQRFGLQSPIFKVHVTQKIGKLKRGNVIESFMLAKNNRYTKGSLPVNEF